MVLYIAFSCLERGSWARLCGSLRDAARGSDVLRAQRERRTDTALNTGPTTTFLRCRRTRCCALR
eukprot:5495701-Prymnesium_polylepis.2